MARTMRQISISFDDDSSPVVRVKVTARSSSTSTPIAAMQRADSGGSPRIGPLRSGAPVPAAVGFCPEADPLGVWNAGTGSPVARRLDGSFGRLQSMDSLPSSYGSKDMEQDVLAAIEGLTTAMHLLDQPGYLAAPEGPFSAAGGAAAAATDVAASPQARKRPLSAKRHVAARSTASSRLAATTHST